MVESFAAGATAATETCKRIAITIAALALLFIGFLVLAVGLSF